MLFSEHHCSQQRVSYLNSIICTVIHKNPNQRTHIFCERGNDPTKPMNQTIDLSSYTVASLAHRCQEETNRYFNQNEADDRFCFELFRHAVVLQNEQAWHLIIEQYSSQIAGWVRRHELFAQANEECDYFVNCTFTNFWRAFNRDTQKFERFKMLSQLLQYLKLCAYTAVKEYVTRRMNPLETQNLTFFPSEDNVYDPARLGGNQNDDPLKSIEQQMGAQKLWQYILAKTKNESEQMIAEAYFLYDKKPQEILATFPDNFADVTEVRRTKDNFLARLRRDKDLLAILDINE